MSKIVVTSRNIGSIGSVGSIADVACGYARNYLIPKKLAIYATPENTAKYELIKQQNEQNSAKIHNLALQVSESIKGKEISIEFNNDGESLYGSIGLKLVCSLINQKIRELKFTDSINSITVSHHQIKTKQFPIKKLGKYQIDFTLYDNICCSVLIDVRGRNDNSI